jgi:hypothetical protein
VLLLLSERERERAKRKKTRVFEEFLINSEREVSLTGDDVDGGREINIETRRKFEILICLMN